MVRLIAMVFSNAAIAVLFGFGGFVALVKIYGSELPTYDELRNYRPNMLSRVYSGKGEVIAEYAKQRRIFIPIDEIPEVVKQAFISAEDKNFYSHPGVDAAGIVKAFVRFAQAKITGSGGRLTGASTITQQVMKNFLVGDDRSIERKIKEAILAVRVESAMTKDQILELYLNDIPFGQRAHGIVAAAENYFGKTVENLEAHEAAYLAALPKGPNNYHPIRNYEAAVARRNYVLREMGENGVLDRQVVAALRETPLVTVIDENRRNLIQRTDPTYFTDEVRRQLIAELGADKLYRSGLTVRATIDDRMQAIAEKALRKALERFDRRRGVYRGPLTRVQKIVDGTAPDWRAALRRARAPRDITGWDLAVVLEVGGRSAVVGVETLEEDTEELGAGKVRLTIARERRWIRRTHKRRGSPRSADHLWDVGDVVLVKKVDNGWSLRQVPEVQGAFMAMDPHSGRVLALQGGFSRDYSSFNRATQAQRQPGSAFKPFVYAAALDVGYTPETIVNDAPIRVADGRRAWTPKNSSGRFNGPISLRRALAKSLNLVTVRLAMDLGMDRVGEYAKRFGVYEKVPDALSYSLGAGETTLYKVVAAYGMFANGGKRVSPTVIDRVQDRHGKTLYRHDPRYCQGCAAQTFGKNRTPILFDARSQIMDPNTAYQLIQMMRGVVEGGTASRTVGGLPFQVAGKTGTTNDNKDAWFVGFSRNLVAGCFIGYDTPRNMGRGSFGGTLCGPVFREFMLAAHKNNRPGKFRRPATAYGTVTIKVHAITGERLPDDAEGPHVLVKTYEMGIEPEILVADRRKIDDYALFTGKNARLLAALPEGEDVPLGARGPRKTRDGVIKRDNVGLGTGGLY